jgi:hypothetical protein
MFDGATRYARTEGWTRRRSGLGARALITIFEAAMAPQIGAAIVAVDHDLDPALVTLMVGTGMPLSFLTLPLGRPFLKIVAA